MKLSRIIFSLLCLVLAGLCIGGFMLYRNQRNGIPLPSGIVRLMPGPTRPYGMAPVAWQAYLRACHAAKIHPRRVGQTIGDSPRSVGYHKRDGTVTVEREKIDYTAAVDLGTWDLTPTQIERFLDALAAQGFAAFYRHKGKWKKHQHIHAIYAFLPMKPQLQIQVREFLQQREKTGKKVHWEKKLKRQRRKLRLWAL